MEKNFPLLKFAIFISVFAITSCKKEIKNEPVSQLQAKAVKENGHLQQTKTFSSDAAQKWMDLQARCLRTPTNANPSRRCTQHRVTSPIG